jgi:hypothetical protein
MALHLDEVEKSDVHSLRVHRVGYTRNLSGNDR